MAAIHVEEPSMAKLRVYTGLLAAASCGCWSMGPSAPTAPAPPADAAGTADLVRRYRCDQNIEFTVRFADDAATIDAGPRGREVLLRDAGGVTPQQTVFSNPQLRAEFGLGSSGREALLRYPSPPLVAHCVRDEAR
jgi:hypothetical protein